LDFGDTNPTEVQNKIVGEMMYGLGSMCLSNPYWSIWGETKDSVLDLNITIDSDGFIGVNSLKNSPGHQKFIMNKGIQRKYEECKSELNLISFS
jgi:hypothetical protein